MKILVLLNILLFVSCQSSTTKLSLNEPVLLPIFSSKEVSPTILAESVNALIDMGEEKAVSYILENVKARDRGAWLCKLLFQSSESNPLRGPGYGSLSLPRSFQPLDTWRYYPLVMSEGVIFVLGHQYWLRGLPEYFENYLEYCRKEGVFMTEKYKIPTEPEQKKAVLSLFKSERWKGIDWDDSTSQITEFKLKKYISNQISAEKYGSKLGLQSNAHYNFDLVDKVHNKLQKLCNLKKWKIRYTGRLNSDSSESAKLQNYHYGTWIIGGGEGRIDRMRTQANNKTKPFLFATVELVNFSEDSLEVDQQKVYLSIEYISNETHIDLIDLLE
ncbi:MAG: hypothetical protein NE328_03090 [Lentisphaeraceae bacterium]|nr:hypothetical protein [Lentisphaeraceae bacterium]